MHLSFRAAILVLFLCVFWWDYLEIQWQTNIEMSNGFAKRFIWMCDIIAFIEIEIKCAYHSFAQKSNFCYFLFFVNSFSWSDYLRHNMLRAENISYISNGIYRNLCNKHNVCSSIFTSYNICWFVQLPQLYINYMYPMHICSIISIPYSLFLVLFGVLLCLLCFACYFHSFQSLACESSICCLVIWRVCFCTHIFFVAFFVFLF